MRFFLNFEERQTADPQELVAMLKHRIAACEFDQKQIDEERIIYSFKSKDGRNTYMGVETDSFESLDRLIKQNPLFPYSWVTTTPVIPLRHLVEEIHEYLNEVLLPPEEVEKLASPPTAPLREGERYYLARKVVKPFSPLLSEDEQRDVARRTVLAQAYHWTELEVYDENPLGQPVGILIAKAQTAEQVREHVAECEVFPDTEMEIIELITIDQCIADAKLALSQLRPPLDPQKYVLMNK